MLFHEGMSVQYKNLNGVISFVSDKSISILIREGKHKAQDVKLVVYRSDFNKVEPLQQK